MRVESRLFILTIPDECITSVSPIYIPTCVILFSPLSLRCPKKIRSPGARESQDEEMSTGSPYKNCCEASRARTIPPVKNIILINPLQSIALEDVPPHIYGEPFSDSAN